MERPLTALIFVISGFAFSALSLLVESKTPDGANPTLSPPMPSPPPPLPSPPPFSPPPPLPSPPPFSPPPPLPSPPPFSPPPPLPSPPPFSPPPPPPPHRNRRSPPPSLASSMERKKKRPPVPPKHINTNRGSKRSRLNKGKKVGLFFVGIAAVLQICVVGFLVFKRRQLLRVKDRYEGFS